MPKKETVSRISVHAHPGAKKNEVVRVVEGVWHIKVAAPPVEGKANKVLIEFLSKKLGVSKSKIIIEKGLTSRYKLVVVEGLTDAQVRERIDPQSPLFKS